MDSDLRQRDRDLAKRITGLDAICKRLYEDSISGKLSDERFQKLSSERSGAGGKQIGGC